MRINDKTSGQYGLNYTMQSIPLRAKKLENLQQISGIGLVDVNLIKEYENFEMVLTFYNKEHKVLDFINKTDIFNDFFKDDYVIIHFFEYQEDIIYVGRIIDKISIDDDVENRKIVQKFNVIFSVKPYKYKIIKPDIINTITSVSILDELVENIDYKLIL